MDGVQKKKGMPLAGQIFIALILGIIAGLALQGNVKFAVTYIKPFGTIFLNLVKFIVGPIVLFSIMAGVVSLSDIRKLGSIGGITLVYYFFTTAIATTIGLIIANSFKPLFPVLSTADLAFKVKNASPGPMKMLVDLFPSNFLAPLTSANMLQVIVMALLIGIAIIALGEKGEKAAAFINTWNDVFMKVMEMILALSPIGVFCLLCPVIAQNGTAVIGSLAKVILCAYIAYALHAILVYSMAVRAIGGMSPLKFFKGMMPAMLFAFSSASSVGTLPINMECANKLGASREVTSFALPLGATINMDGTAIYQGVCAVFIASCYGIDLTLPQMLTIVITATLASVGTAGVPGAGMIMLAMVLEAIGIPVAYIGLIVAVDRLFDMGRTCLNVTGDIACSLCVTKWESKKK